MAWPDTTITDPDWVAGLINTATMKLKSTDRFNLLVARVGITGPVSTGILPTDAAGNTTGGALNTLGGQGMVKAGADIVVYCQVTLHSAISVPADGDVGNVPIALIPAPFTPVSFVQPLVSGGSGPMCHFAVLPSGVVSITSTAPGVVLGAGKLISFGGKMSAL